MNRGQDYWVWILGNKNRIWLAFLSIYWMLSLSWFLGWWFEAEHIVGWGRFVVNTVLLLWTVLVPGYFIYFVNRMKMVNPALQIPKHWRVAMVVTKAPSEPWPVVQKTLKAMLAQRFPHDTWLADEDPSPTVKRWCARNSVRISSRKGVEAYHQQTWPRRTKCKEGNLAYFYDTWGYAQYDFVAQLDADHVPDNGYLEAMLRPFIDDEVGYVSAPSICDANAEQSWAARGRLYLEASMHGAMQAGYNDGWAPLCIGSHYAVRTKALQEIGGLGPELAEDHSTTLMMNGFGWLGVHAMDAIAHGDGPLTVADAIVQEFQWSRSLMVVLLTELPKYWKNLNFKLKFQFLFSELWFSLFGLALLIGHLIPVVALLMRSTWVRVSYLDFLVHLLPITFALLALVYFLKTRGCLRPVTARVLSWEGILFELVRWPWALYGSVMGIWQVVSKQQLEFKVTPKQKSDDIVLPWRIWTPYILLIVVAFSTSWLITNAGDARGYYYFLIVDALLYLVAMVGLFIMHTYEAQK